MVELARLVKPDERIHLNKIDAGDHAGISRDDAEDRLTALGAEFCALQELLWASASHAVLIVLQGLDTAGKDGTISHVMSNVNPQGCAVASFKVPTPIEAAHDFLWRAHLAAPARG